MKMTNFLPLVEQFHSLQGEGYHAGKSAFFVRLAGCKVGCSWCDTKNSWNEKKHPSISIEKIIDRIKIARKKGASFCVITGGEPLQPNLDNFCNAIKKMTMGEEQKPMKIHIETSGVNSISGSYDWITLSPKRHSPPKNYFLKNCNEIKIIINEYMLERGIISSTANSYVCVARVSKLKGLKIKVIGNSFIMSIKTNVKAIKKEYLFIGKYIF